jgi:hypothetical protein
MCTSNADALSYGTPLYPWIQQAFAGSGNQSCANVDGRPIRDPISGLCMSPQGSTGAEMLPVVGFPQYRRRNSPADLKSWRWTSDASKICTPTVPDPFGLGQQVPNPFYLTHHGKCTQRGYQACVDGLCVPGCPRKACLQPRDTACTRTCQFGTCQPEWWKRNN